MKILDDAQAAALEALCELLVPGSGRVGPVVYVDAVLAAMPPEARAGALAAIDALAPAAAAGAGALAERERTPEFGLVRALAVEAYYSDFVAPDAEGPGAWSEIDFNTPLARRLDKDWSYLTADGDERASARSAPRSRTATEDGLDVVVVGSGAGGGVVAGELAQRGRRVLLLEIGPHLTAADFVRWEAKATHDLFWPLRLALLPGGEPFVFLAGRCVGGTTTINTKVALRAHAQDVAKWHAATGLTNERGEPFGTSDLDPYYDRVEQVLGVRERRDWTTSVRTVERGFQALGAELEPVRSYTDANCMRCGSCLQGCSTNAGKSTMNTYIHDAWVRGLLELQANAAVERVLVEDSADGPRATGVEYTDAAGERHAVRARAVVLAAGTLNTPQLLLRSGLGGPAVGRHLGLHPTRLVYGLFDEPQDAHMVYPITAHCTAHQHDADGGFVTEATTIQDPIAFATTLCDDNGPLWGPRLVEAARGFRHWVGLLALANDDNNGAVLVDDDGRERFEVDFQPAELERIDHALRFGREVLEAAGATEVCWTGLVSTHVQGTCRMGDDPARSVVDRNCESHDVSGLFVGDGSLVPRTLSVNPSLTIMALATRLADHLDAVLAA